MKTPSSKDIRIAQLETEATVNALALHDVVRGDVRWFGNARRYQVGVTRPSCGGIAIVRTFDGGTDAHYLVRFAQRELEHISMCITGENSEYNRELLARRSAIEAAQAYVRECLRADVAA